MRPCSSSDCGAQVEHRAHAEQRQLVELVVGEAVEGVGPVQRAPANRLPGPASVAAQVAEVERTLEAESAVGMVGGGDGVGVGHRVEARGERAVHGNSSGRGTRSGAPAPDGPSVAMPRANERALR